MKSVGQILRSKPEQTELSPHPYNFGRRVCSTQQAAF
jgi:hypothetical protein